MTDVLDIRSMVFFYETQTGRSVGWSVYHGLMGI